MAIFDVIGPIMIGPSSSHTAGAARIGYFAREIYRKPFDLIEIDLYNSFSETGKGHGTDIAILGGLLGFMPDDSRILQSYEYTQKMGILFKINWMGIDEDLPENVSKITFHSSGKQFFIIGNSIGGGKVEIININGYPVKISGKHDTIVVFADDVPGIVAYIAKLIAESKINIASMDVERDSSIGEALSLIKLDSEFPDWEIAKMINHKHIRDIIKLKRLG
jgi:L-serine dehydratase